MRPLVGAAAALALLAASPARAAVAVPSSVEDLARSSQAVVRGTVASVFSQWNDEGTRIFTYAQIDVASVWRGAPATRRITVLTPGGVVGDLGQRVDGAATFRKGEEVVVFLFEGQEPGVYRVSGLAQGKFSVKDATARPDLTHTGFVGGGARPGERRAEAMDVAELERRVRSVQ